MTLCMHNWAVLNYYEHSTGDEILFPCTTCLCLITLLRVLIIIEIPIEYFKVSEELSAQISIISTKTEAILN